MRVSKKGKKRLELWGKLLAAAIAVVLVGGLVAILFHKPSSPALTSLVTAEPGSEAPASEPVKAPPRLARLPLPAMDFLPGGAAAGVYFGGGAALAGIERALGLRAGTLFPESLLSLETSGALAVYADAKKGVAARGALLFSDASKAAEFAKRAAESGLRVGPFSLQARAEGKVVALAGAGVEPELIRPDTLKPVRRLSQDYSVQAASGVAGDYRAFLFLSPTAATDFPEACFPVREGDRDYRDVLKGLGMSRTRSVTVGFDESGEWEVRTDRTSDEGLAGLPSSVVTTGSTADCFPAGTLLYAAQTLDIPRFLRSMGGFLTFLAPIESNRLPSDLEEKFVGWGIAPGFLLRLLSGEASFGVWLEGVLPAGAMVAEVSDEKLVRTMFAVLEGEGLVKRGKAGGKPVWIFAEPLLTVPLGAGMTYWIQPVFMRDGKRLVAAANMMSLRRVASVLEGKSPALSGDEGFKEALGKAGKFSSLVFLRTSDAAARLRPLLAAAGLEMPPAGGGGCNVWSAVSEGNGALRIRSDCPLLLPFVSYAVRPEWVPVGASLAGMYDRLITMALRACNWTLRRLSYYDVRSLDLTLDLRREPWEMDCALELETVVEGSTGYTFLLNPAYEIESVTLDGEAAGWKSRGPFLAVRSPRLLKKGEVNRLRIKAKGIPEDMLLAVPRKIADAFRFRAHSVKEPGLIHLTSSALFYPMQPALTNDLWTSRTTLFLPAGWRGVSDGRPVSVSEGPDGAQVWRYEDDRPEQALEVTAGPFRYVKDEGKEFTVHHFFEEGAVPDEEGAARFARECYAFYVRTFGGEYNREPVIVHLRARPGISHCLAYVLTYGYRPQVLAHELGHMWWGGLVKENPLTSAMWYEGLTEYSCMMFFRSRDPEAARKMRKRAFAIWRGRESETVRYRDIRPWSPGRGLLGYYKGVAMFAGLEYLLGEEGFRKFTRALAARTFEFADLKTLWETVTGIDPDLSWYVRSAFFGRGAFDIELKGISESDDGCEEVEVRSVGLNPWRGPVEVLITTEDGSTAVLKGVFEGSARLYLKYEGKGKIVSAVADPEEKIPDYNLDNNRYARTERSGKK